MIQNFVKAWDANKDKLKEYFQTHSMSEYDEYVKLVQLLFNIVINPYLEKVNPTKQYDADIDEITVIDNGEYQGTQLFVLHEKTYQPAAYEYVLTHQSYGSCSGCDTLQGIQVYSSDIPDEEQVNDHMTLCLHLLQRCKEPFSYEEYKETW